MKSKLCATYLMGLLATCFSITSFATSFISVYKQALQNDPTFKKAYATWQSQKMNLPIADSSYLPQLTAIGNGARNYTYNYPSSISIINNYNWTYGYSLTLTQTVFDLGAWNNIKSADAIVKAATAAYIAAQQSLMQRTAQAYFDVIRSYETLGYIIANKSAIWNQYVASQKKFKAGLIAIMDVYDAKSRYDQITAQEITARNNLSNKLEALHAITGKYYTSLNGLGKYMVLIKPVPADMDAWTQTAIKQNYNLLAQRYNMLSAMRKIGQQAAGDVPTLGMSTGYSQSQAVDNSNDHMVTDQATIGLDLSYKPIQGGLVHYSTRQARYNYLSASDELGVIYQQVVNQTHNNFTGVMSSLLRVQADRLRIVSANKALIATEAGLKVGVRTMVDVLNDLTTLYLAQQQFVDDEYTYLTNYVDLKAATGTLKFSDMAHINCWLNKNIDIKKLNTQWSTFDLNQMAEKKA